MKKFLLLNPPGDKTYFRDYYCTKVSKARYYYHPVDLLYLSGRLTPFYNLKLIDAIAGRQSAKECLEQIKDFKPDIVLSLVSSPSYFQDLDFLKQIKIFLPGVQLVVTGDIFRELRQQALKENDFLDAILLDFSTNDLVNYLGRSEDGEIDNVIYRSSEIIFAGQEIHGFGEFDVPLPRWDLFDLKKYFFPFARKSDFASILSDFGCPFQCDFCPVSSLGYRLRPVESVVAELKILRNMGVKELFFRDQTFGVNPERTIKLCRAITKAGLNFSWSCFSRVDVTKESLLKEMKVAGCHTIIFGIESSDENILTGHQKNIKIEQIEQALKLAKQNGIRTAGTFILGFPDDTEESINRTINLAKKLDLDFASFNIATPRYGTKLRQSALAEGLIDCSVCVMESADSKPIWRKSNLSNEKIYELKNRAMRSFYLRPAYLFKRLLGIRSWQELKNNFLEAIELLRKIK